MLRGGFLQEELKPADMRKTATPEELLRCYEEKVTGEDGKVSVKKISLMLRRDVPQFRTLFFSRCMTLYNNWRLFNKMPPCGNGWADERNVTSEILSLLEAENNKYDLWEHEKDRERKNLR